MSAVTVFVPKDAAAASVGADDVAAVALSQEAQSRGLDINLVRNGSRGLLWLEPLVEVDTPSGRVAFGPVAVRAISAGLFDAGFLSGGDHDLGHGSDRGHSLSGQPGAADLCPLRRCIDPSGFGWPMKLIGGLVGLKKALELEPSAIVEDVTAVRVAGPGRCRLPRRAQMGDRAQRGRRSKVYLLQRR